jgi:hypothetical protein
MTEGRKLAEVSRIMERQYGFRATYALSIFLTIRLISGN